MVELIDRETNLLMRGVKESNLEGLRKRIATLFFQYIKNPTFNPQVSKLLRVCTNVAHCWLLYFSSKCPILRKELAIKMCALTRCIRPYNLTKLHYVLLINGNKFR